MKVVFFGTPEFVVPVLRKIAENFDLVAVVTNPDKPVGRHQRLTPSPVKSAFLTLFPDRKERVLIPDKMSSKGADEGFLADFKSLSPDLAVIASYAYLIPQEILDLPRYGSLNIHPSLLPKYRGVSPMPTAILNGDAVSGVTIYKMDAEMDHGPIIAQEEFELSPKDTYASLSREMFQKGANMLIRTLPDYIQGNVNLKPQDERLVTYTHFIQKQDGYFDIDSPPEKLDKMIRAFYPWPTVWTRWKGKVVKLLPESLIQMEGKKPVPLKDFLNGHPDFPLKIF